MATFTHGPVTLHYEAHGAGDPVLLFAPGGMRSAAALWERAPFHPVRELAQHHQVIAMDQRNAGESRAPITASDGWHSYTEDHLALLDHLRIERCHVLGMCIGGAFALRLAVHAPRRVKSAVLLQPIGFDGTNRELFQKMFDEWTAAISPSRPDATADAFAGLRANLFGGDFVYAVSRADVLRCDRPLLVLRGNDAYHPAAVSEEVARIAPHAEIVMTWKEGDDRARAIDRIKAFLGSHAGA